MNANTSQQSSQSLPASQAPINRKPRRLTIAQLQKRFERLDNTLSAKIQKLQRALIKAQERDRSERRWSGSTYQKTANSLEDLYHVLYELRLKMQNPLHPPQPSSSTQQLAASNGNRQRGVITLGQLLALPNPYGGLSSLELANLLVEMIREKYAEVGACLRDFDKRYEAQRPEREAYRRKIVEEWRRRKEAQQ